MSLATSLIGFGLRQVIGDAADDFAGVVGAVEQRFRDHSGTLPKALDQAHNRAWQALGVALAGDGLLDRVRVLFASGDDKGVREQVQLFLKSNAVSFDGTPAAFRQACLDDLKRLRKSGLLSTQGGSPADIARLAQQAAGLRRHTDPQGLIEESRRAVAGVADALAEGCPNLAKLLRTPTPAGPPLLAAAFCYFFRREVETDDELAHGLFFDGLRRLSASQAKAFGGMRQALDAIAGRFDELFERLDRIGATSRGPLTTVGQQDAPARHKPRRGSPLGSIAMCTSRPCFWNICTKFSPSISVIGLSLANSRLSRP